MLTPHRHVESSTSCLVARSLEGQEELEDVAEHWLGHCPQGRVLAQPRVRPATQRVGTAVHQPEQHHRNGQQAGRVSAHMKNLAD